MYKNLVGVFLTVASLCFPWEAQAASLLENLASVEENSLYERLDFGKVKIGDQIYEVREYTSLLEDMEKAKESISEEDSAKKESRQAENTREEETQKENTQEENTGKNGTEITNQEQREKKSLSTLQEELEGSIRVYPGNWEIYVKDLGGGESFSIGDESSTSASLIKTFVMASVYDQVEKGTLQETPQLNELLELMITVSDNEAYNELVRQLGGGDFLAGCQVINQYLQEQGYTKTGVHHTLHPSSSLSLGDGQSNMTSVSNCGVLLERIYQGKCVSEEASQKMLNLLLDQQTNWKIPAGIPEEIQVANKTGETDSCQHDIAIVYAPQTTYILCIMSFNLPDETTGVSAIQELSTAVYEYFSGQGKSVSE